MIPTVIPPGTIFPTKYQKDVRERRDFRQRMKAELRNMAKESFLEELERLRQGSPHHDHLLGLEHGNNADVDRQMHLENEITRLQNVVEDIRRQQHNLSPTTVGNPAAALNNNNMQVEWSNPIIRDQFDHHDYHHHTNSNSHGHTNNQHFVLSCAPIQGFDELIKQETSIFRDTLSFTQIKDTNSNNNVNNAMNLMEQANRFAEMQSLFQIPLHPTIGMGAYEEDPGHYHTGNHSANQSRGNKREIREQREQRERRLEATISTHKERLDKGRHPVRRFPMNAPAPGSHHASSFQSPRVKIHSKNLQQANNNNNGNNNGNSNGYSGNNNANSSNNNNNGNSHSNQNESPTNFGDSPNRSISPTTLNNPNAGPADSPAKPTSPEKQSQPVENTVLTLEEFRDKAEKLNDKLKQLVHDAVQEELLKETKALRYTKRFQNHYISTQQAPIQDRIEKTVEDKIKALQIELAALRTSRLNKTPPRRNRNGSNNNGAGGDEDNDGEEHDSFRGDGNGNWLLRNELDGDATIDMRTLTHEINKSVQHILKRHLGGHFGEGGEGMSSTVHGHITANDASARDDDKDIGFESHDGPSHQMTNYIPQPVVQTTTGGLAAAGSSLLAHLSGARGKAATNNSMVVGESPSMGGSSVPTKADDILAAAVVKPKSKADRLLGISQEANNRPQMIHNELMSQRGGSQQGGLFGSIGSLFQTSSKPQSGGGLMGSSMVSDRFGLSNRSSHSHHGSGGSSHAAASSKPPPLMEVVEESNDHEKEQSLRSSAISASEKIKGAASSLLRGGKLSRKNSMAGEGSSSKSEQGGMGEYVMNPALTAEIASEETNYRQLMSNLLNLADVKMNVKKELKDWERDFENKNGRPPSIEDKTPMNDRYIAYKMICNQVQEAKDLVKASEDKLKELREKAGRG